MPASSRALASPAFHAALTLVALDRPAGGVRVDAAADAPAQPRVGRAASRARSAGPAVAPRPGDVAPAGAVVAPVPAAPRPAALSRHIHVPVPPASERAAWAHWSDLMGAIAAGDDARVADLAAASALSSEGLATALVRAAWSGRVGAVRHLLATAPDRPRPWATAVGALIAAGDRDALAALYAAAPREVRAGLLCDGAYALGMAIEFGRSTMLADLLAWCAEGLGASDRAQLFAVADGYAYADAAGVYATLSRALRRRRRDDISTGRQTHATDAAAARTRLLTAAECSDTGPAARARLRDAVAAARMALPAGAWRSLLGETLARAAYADRARTVEMLAAPPGAGGVGRAACLDALKHEDRGEFAAQAACQRGSFAAFLALWRLTRDDRAALRGVYRGAHASGDPEVVAWAAAREACA